MSNSISLLHTCPLVKLHLYLFYTSVFQQIKQASWSVLLVSLWAAAALIMIKNNHPLTLRLVHANRCWHLSGLQVLGWMKLHERLIQRRTLPTSMRNVHLSSCSSIMCAAGDFLIEAVQSRDFPIWFGSAKSEVLHIFIRWFSRQNRIWK